MDARTRKILYTLIASAQVVFFVAGSLRYGTFHNETFDLAFYARIAWGLPQGDLNEPVVGANILGLHLSPVLFVVGCAGWLVGQVRALLFVQAAALAFAALPLARIAHRRFGEIGAIGAAVVWLVYPNLFQVAAAEAHPGTLAVLPLAYLCDALDRRDPRAFVWAFVGVLMCREDLGLMAACFALFGAYASGPHRRLYLGLAAVSLAYVAFFALVLLPVFGPQEQGSLALHFGHWGTSLPTVLAYLAAHPAELWAHLAEPERARYLLVIVVPLGGMALLAPEWLLLCAPVLLMNLLSQFPGTTDLGSHYLTPATPVLAAATWIGLERAVRHACRPSGYVIALALTAIGVHIAIGRSPASLHFDSAPFVEDSRTRAASSIVSRIPSAAPVQAPYELLPHLAERRLVYRAPPPERRTPYTVLSVAHRLGRAGDQDLIRTSEEPLVRNWLAKTTHTLLVANDYYLLFQVSDKGPREGVGGRAIVGHVDPRLGTPITGCLAVLDARVLPSRELVLRMVARSACAADLTLLIGTGWKPSRADLPFSGRLSPRHLKAGDLLESRHALSEQELQGIATLGLRVGAVRQSGARPDPSDPTAIHVALKP